MLLPAPLVPIVDEIVRRDRPFAHRHDQNELAANLSAGSTAAESTRSRATSRSPSRRSAALGGSLQANGTMLRDAADPVSGGVRLSLIRSADADVYGLNSLLQEGSRT